MFEGQYDYWKVSSGVDSVETMCYLLATAEKRTG